MVELLTHIMQYISIALIVLLTIKCFISLNRDEEKTSSDYYINMFMIILLNASLNGPIILHYQNWYYIFFYVAQFMYLVLFPFVFRLLYPKANKLLINLISVMLGIGMPILIRLNTNKAVKQGVFIIAGSIIVLFIPLFLRKFEVTKKLAGAVGVIGLMLLAMVLVLSKTTYGANLSLNIGPISLQPSEFVKITYVLLIAKLFRQKQDFGRVSFVAGVAMLHTVVLVLSKDLGGAVIYYSIFLVMVYIATGKKRYPLLGTVILCFGAVAAYYLFAHVRVRVTAWLDPWSVIENQGYQVAQSLFAIADGKWLGTGLFLGSPASIPIVEKDFIFSAICEELGIIFGICIILLSLLMVLTYMKISAKTSVAFYKLIAAGLATAYGIQSFLTIGGALKFIPSTGVTLAFVSYGGSSLLSSIMIFGVLQGLYIKANKVEAAKRLDEELKSAVSEVSETTEDGKTVIRKRVKVPNKKQKRVLQEDDTARATVITESKYGRVVSGVFTLVFSACVVYSLYFVAVASEQDIITKNTFHTARKSSSSAQVIRGSILGSDGVVLAYTETDENGNEYRYYPYANLFSHIVGYTKGGKTGVESIANSYLLTASRSVSENLNADIKDKSKKSGDNVCTSIDPSLQYNAYNAMGGYKGAIVVMEADTGRVLAMISKPDYNPNEMDEIWSQIANMDSSESFLVNRAMQGIYPPGSTFKLLTALAYMRENPNSYWEYTYNCLGRFNYENISLSCSEGHQHGMVDLSKALAESCNGAFANIGVKLKNSSLIRIAEDFGFNQKLDLCLPSKKSSLPVSEATTSLEKTQVCIGQGAVLETPIHNAMITCAIANGGTLVKPRIIDSVVSSTGRTIESFDTEKLGTVMTANETYMLEQYMLNNVENGTAFNAQSTDYMSAGKTGSAQFGSDNTRFHSWYTGYAWQEDGKKIVVSIVLEDGGSGGWIAAPVAKEIFDAYFGVGNYS